MLKRTSFFIGTRKVMGHTGKIPFFTRQEAEHMARRHGVSETVYKCEAEFRTHFHLTSMGHARIKQIRKKYGKRNFTKSR